MKFKNKKLVFDLITPDYEIPVFGYRIGEIRLLSNPDDIQNALPLEAINDYLKDNKIPICTFRGKEDIEVIRLLEDLGFRFVSTYCIAECYKSEFVYVCSKSEMIIRVGSVEECNEIINISAIVSDYSTFSIDPLIPFDKVSKRNIARAKAIIAKPNHRVYMAEADNQITGFIQYTVDMQQKKAFTQCAAINPKFHKQKVGETLFQESLRSLFEEGYEVVITDSYSTQNIGSYKLHAKNNFRIIDHEIHLRLFTEIDR